MRKNIHDESFDWVRWISYLSSVFRHFLHNSQYCMKEFLFDCCAEKSKLHEFIFFLPFSVTEFSLVIDFYRPFLSLYSFRFLSGEQMGLSLSLSLSLSHTHTHTHTHIENIYVYSNKYANSKKNRILILDISRNKTKKRGGTIRTF